MYIDDMSGVTVAPQPTKNDSDTFLASFNANPTSSLHTLSDMESLLPSHGWPMEDLTSEVHDLLLRESTSWLPWMEDLNHSVKTGSPMESLDSQLLTQTLQLNDLFGQELNFDSFGQVESSLLYDEFTFDPSPVSIPTSTQAQQLYEQQQQQQQQQLHTDISPDTNEHSSSSTIPVLPCEDKTPETTMEMQDDSSTDDDDDNDINDSDGDDSDDEQLDGPVSVLTSTYMYLPKRQVEEALLNKISHQLQPDKLPGILSIVSSSTDSDDDQVHGEEVEIDLSCLVREQLVRVMLYVDACITEQQGGPVVILDHYLVGGSNNKSINRKARTISTQDDGPISMAALTKKSRSSMKQQSLAKTSTTTNKSKRRRRTRRKSDQGTTATTRPTRRAALHKRRMLEDMLLVHSDNDDDMKDGLDQQVMVTYGEEEMDFKVVENQTIVHQPHVSPPAYSLPSSDGDLCVDVNDDDDDDEEIDIM